MTGLPPEAVDDLQAALLAIFEKFGVSVAVGRTRLGIAIRSQDERVDAANIGPITALSATDTEAP